MITTVLAVFSIAAYLGGAFFIFRRIHHLQPPSLLLFLSWSAALGHLLFILISSQEHHGFNFSFVSTASLVSLIVALLLLMEMIKNPVEKLGIVIFPIAAVMLGLEVLFPAKQHNLHTYNWEMNAHILTSIIAFSLLNIAALQAILLAIQDQQLKRHPPKPFILSLPSLQTMEALLFQMLRAGVLFLTASLISGFLFIDDLFAQHLAHKTILSILAWIIFTGLLIGRQLYGWRGVTATKLTLAGFLLLILAYFGSKFVLELLLHRS